MTEEEKQIVAWLREPFASKWVLPKYRERLWFAWAFLCGRWGTIDGIRWHVANAIERGEHRQHSPAKDDSQ